MAAWLPRLGALLVALASATLGAWMAAHHPLAPGMTMGLWAVSLLAAWWWPHAWLWVLPACLPVAGLAPWTGWIAGDEFDLLVLGTLAAGHARLALGPALPSVPPAWAPHWRRVGWLAFSLGAWLTLGTALGWADAQVLVPPLPEAYLQEANTWRVAKSLAYVLLALPLMRAAWLCMPEHTAQRLGQGMVAGLTLMVGATLWERKAFPGLLDFSAPYRTVGAFWEMHVGGAAIDGFLALSLPLAIWALVHARRKWSWLLAAVLVQVLAYVCLTTFARGVYGAVGGGLAVAGFLAYRQRSRGDASHTAPPPAWRARANRVLRVLVVLEVAAMALASSFMVGRLSDVDNDFGDRWAHWTRGLATLQSPADWVHGIGVGRLPAHYASLGVAGELPGAAELMSDGEGQYLRLHGPSSRVQLAGRYALTQQVQVVPGARYRIAMDIRASQTTRVRVLVCERHLLYADECQWRSFVRMGRAETQWQSVTFDLLGPPLTRGSAWAPRLVSLSLTVTRPGTSIDIDNVRLSAGEHDSLLRNGDFESGLARWFPAVRSYFLPWHIDNLYLETLIERGVVGLFGLALLVGTALWRVAFGAARDQPMAPYLAAALASAAALGLVSSLLDMPRIAFLLLLLAFWSLLMPPAARARTAEPLCQRECQARA